MLQAAVVTSSRSRFWLALAALAGANALWGMSFLLGKIALAELGPGQVIAARFMVAVAVMLPALWGMFRRLVRADVPLLVLSGVLMVPVMMLVQFEGLQRTSATHAALIIGSIPVLMAVGSALFDRERVALRTWLAAGVSSIGLAWMVLGAAPRAGGDLLGDLLVLASAITAVAWTLVTRRLLKRYPPLALTAASMAIGTLALLPITLMREGMPAEPVSVNALLSLLALGVLCTAVTYGLWNWGLRHVPTSLAGLTVNFEPLVGATAGILILQEPTGLSLYLGGAAILLAAVWAATARSPQREATPEARRHSADSRWPPTEPDPAAAPPRRD